MACAVLPLSILSSFHTPDPSSVRIHCNLISAQSEDSVVHWNFSRNVWSSVRHTGNQLHTSRAPLDRGGPSLDFCLQDRTWSSGARGGSVKFGLPELALPLTWSCLGD
eukprot:3017521-Rhodomonas_salina.4